MTVNSDLSRARYVGNGVTTTFAIPFAYLTNNDGTAQVAVYVGDSDTPLIEDKDYTVKGFGKYSDDLIDEELISYETRYENGEFTLFNTPALGQPVAVIRNVPQTQGVVFVEGEKFPAQDFENALDKLTMQVQEIKENMERSIILPPTSTEKPIEVRDNIIQTAKAAQQTSDEAIIMVTDAKETLEQGIVTVQTETENAVAVINSTKTEAVQEVNDLKNDAVTNIENKVVEATNEVNTVAEGAVGQVNSAVEGNIEKSRIWAEGEQAEVKHLGGELSSMGAADLAYAIANAPEDTPIDASGLFAMNVVKGPKGDKGDKGEDGKDGGGLEIGDIAFAALGIDESKNLRRYLNGQVISQSQFESFTNKVKTAIQLNPSLATSETNWQAEVTNSPYGICGKFVIDDEAGTIRLPKYPDWSIREVGQAAVVGNGTNLTFEQLEGKSNPSGLVIAPSTAVLYSYGAGNYNYPMGVTTDATKSGMIADLVNANTEDKLQGKWFIQVATGVEESVDVTREIELNNPFSLLDYKWSEYEITNASWLLSNGAFHSGAVYKSVYELLLKLHNGTETKDGVSVKLSTEAYEDTDFVINTADTTFRLPIKVKLASGNAVVGNGITLGLTDGSSNYGLYQGNGPLAVASTAYGINLPSSGSNSGNPAYDKRLGITTDPTKSGLVLSDNDMYLYFYVGETIQDANVINASGVLTRVAELSNEYIVGLGMPDYSAGVNIAVPTSSSNAFVAQYACYMQGISMKAYYGTFKAYINGVEYILGQGNNVNENQSNNIYLFLPKGTTVYFTSGYVIASSLYVFPLKGVN